MPDTHTRYSVAAYIITPYMGRSIFRKNLISVKQNGYLAPYMNMKNIKIKLMPVLKPALQPARFLVINMLIISLSFSGCRDICPSSYTLELPKMPDILVSLLGEPHWQIEWIDPAGQKQTAIITPNDSGIQLNMEIKMPVTFANPVIAWPYWSNHNLIPGHFKPAGALFPFDVNGGNLCLSWEAGVDAFFYWELVYANENNLSKIPANFDWPRFRELFKGETLSEAVRKDPWLVNWRSAAERTISGNFDSRRLIPEETELKTIPYHIYAQTDNWSGVWYGTSMFEKPLTFAEGESPVFKIRPGINIWISEKGILRVNGNAWVFNDIY